MVLSNAERQARHRQRLKAGVTADEVRRAARLMWEAVVRGEVARPGDSPPSWGAYLDRCAKKRDLWRANLRTMTSNREDYEGDFPEADVDLLVKVGAVMEAVFNPPRE